MKFNEIDHPGQVDMWVKEHATSEQYARFEASMADNAEELAHRGYGWRRFCADIEADEDRDPTTPESFFSMTIFYTFEDGVRIGFMFRVEEDDVAERILEVVVIDRTDGVNVHGRPLNS